MRRFLPLPIVIALLVGCAGVPEPPRSPAARGAGAASAGGARTSAASAPVENAPKTSALFNAIWEGDVGGIRAQVAAGADPSLPLRITIRHANGTESPGLLFPILGVVGNGKLSAAQKAEVISILAKAGADLNIRDEEGRTALYKALAWEDSPEIARALLENGANAGATVSVTEHWILDGKKVDRRYDEAPLFTLVKNRDIAAADKARLIPLLRERKADLNPQDYNGVTPINWVLDAHEFEGKEIIVRALLEAGADPNAADKNGNAVLYSLIVSTDLPGYLDLVRLAVRSGADPCRLGYGKKSILHSALDSHYYANEAFKSAVKLTELLDILLSNGADVDLRDADGSTALFAALEQRQEDVARYLVARGASARATDKEGRTLLHVLAEFTEPASDGLWRMAGGADLDAQDRNGNTALNLAAGNDASFDAVRRLVEMGADLGIANDDELAPRGTATQRGAKKNAAYLKEKGGALYVARFPAGNEAAAAKAVLSGDLAAVAATPLEELGAMKARTSLGVPATPLHLAVERGDAALVAALCRRTVDWNVRDRYGRTPLGLAVIAGRSDLVELLLAAGADPNWDDLWHSTPFSSAVGLRPDIARLMLAKGHVPKNSWPAICSIYTGDFDLLKSLYPTTKWDPEAMQLCAAFGETRIAEYIGQRVPPKGKTQAELLEEARKNEAILEAYSREAAEPLEAPRRSGGIAEKRGAFTYVVESWSPWMEMKVGKQLKDYPVGVYVPKTYDGSRPYGLLVSMIHAQSANQYPRPEFAKVLDKLNLIWVAFDPYNGIYEPFEDTHECLCLAIVYNMLGYYSIDRSRVYAAGFSWGGRLVGEMVPKYAKVFKGGIAMGGCFTTSGRLVPALRYGRGSIAMVMATGDYDYNRTETYGGYSTLLDLGYRNCLFIQEPAKGHAIMSAENFEKALRFLDARLAPR